ncbi:MAG: nicotinate-nucleotide--dimethylbenzimidazole phosphoribosyltransferase [Planctomycetota bacterium]|nr:MAG: nicotinate-nucleotide--dimethylbenzimidazole phosphoribosyltransferase [Planctomycetota bacterium]
MILGLIVKITLEDIQKHLDSLTKPIGSLARLEEIAAQLCLCQQTLQPQTRPRNMVLFAADHGVVAEGVSAWPSEVTELMIQNILGGGAASSVLARNNGTALRLVDVGSLGQPRVESESYRCAKLAAGTANLAKQPAMTKAQFEEAYAVGQQEAEDAVQGGARILASGEMGIGNTTAATCLTALLCGCDVASITGRGAGADDAVLHKKIAVIRKAVERVQRSSRGDLVEDIAALCGFEIAAMAGFYSRAAELTTIVVIDGFIATAAALIAERLAKGSREYMIASHSSAEQGHRHLLNELQLRPLLEWSMRLGEGSGALLVMPMLDAAAEITKIMATFESLGIER